MYLLSLFFSGEKKSRKKQREKKSLTKNINLKNGETFLSLSINPGVDKGPYVQSGQEVLAAP